MVFTQKKFDPLKNERGFTLLELLIASVLSVIMIALVAGIFQSQNKTFVLQNQLNKMQVNGRAATEFLSRAVQNAGYNVFRGTRFLAASDHYISAVYDQDNDGVIQNDEVMTFAVGNPFSSIDDTISIVPFFDMDQNGSVAGTESATYPITMTLTAPPYNLYKVIPDNSGVGFSRNTVARDLDNLIIRYYGKNGNLLPTGIDADNDGVPDTGSYVVPLSELNDIRKVDIEIIARTRDEDPRSGYKNTGTYLAGSVATQGGGTYSDGFHRQTFTGNISPRNLVMAPWGKMDVVPAPATVNCPVDTSNITATLVDANGVPVGSGININFAVDGGGNATVFPASSTTNSFGEATTAITYDWSAPNASITISANSLINAGGQQNPVFNASSVNFQSGTGTFADTFNGGLDPNWVELDNPADVAPVDTNADLIDDALQMSATGLVRAVNGCNWQKYQVEFEMTPSGDIDFGAVGPALVGGFLRYQDQNSNYSAVVEKTAGNCLPGDGLPYCLKIIKWDGFAVTTLGTLGANLDFISGIKYKILAEAEDDNLRAKIWNANLPADVPPGLGLADPNPGNWNYADATFPTVYRLETTDPDITSGRVGFVGDWTNGTDVIFDNIVANPIP